MNSQMELKGEGSMERIVRSVRNIVFLVLLVAAAVATEKKVFATSCGSYFIGFDSV